MRETLFYAVAACTLLGFGLVLIAPVRPVKATTLDSGLAMAPFVLSREVQSPATAVSAAPRPLSTERFEDYTRGHQEKHDLEREALTRARETIDFRLREMNELRSQINLERGTYVTRIAFQVQEERLNKIEQAQASAQSYNLTWMAAMGVIFTIVQVGLRFLPAKPNK